MVPRDEPAVLKIQQGSTSLDTLFLSVDVASLGEGPTFQVVRPKKILKRCDFQPGLASET